MPTVEFKAKVGSRLKNLDAQIIGSYLKERFGDLGVTAEEFVADAEHADSPLHDYLEWDNTEAAEQYRLTQARQITRSIEIVYVPRRGADEIRTRAFPIVAVQRGGSVAQTYVPIEVVAQNSEMVAQVGARFVRDIQILEDRYAAFQELQEEVAGLRRIRVNVSA